MKKVLAFLLTAVMLLGCMPMVAFADGEKKVGAIVVTVATNIAGITSSPEDVVKFVTISEPMVGYHDGSLTVRAINNRTGEALGEGREPNTFILGEKYTLEIGLCLNEHFRAETDTSVTINNVPGYLAIGPDGLTLYGFTIEAKSIHPDHVHMEDKENATDHENKATCNSDCYVLSVCKSCGFEEEYPCENENHVKEKVAHKYKVTKLENAKEVAGEYVVRSCAKDGQVVSTCEVCGDVKTEKVVAQHSNLETITVFATCEKGEYTAKRCGVCETIIEDSIEYNPDRPALGHSDPLNVTVVNPTCDEEGYTLKECTRSGCDFKVKEEQKPALGHKIVADPDNGMQHKCVNDGCDFVENHTCAITNDADGHHCSICCKVCNDDTITDKSAVKHDALPHVYKATIKVEDKDGNEVDKAVSGVKENTHECLVCGRIKHHAYKSATAKDCVDCGFDRQVKCSAIKDGKHCTEVVVVKGRGIFTDEVITYRCPTCGLETGVEEKVPMSSVLGALVQEIFGALVFVVSSPIAWISKVFKF